MNFKDWSGVVGTWVSISAAILGGYLALQNYKQDVATRQTEVAKHADARVVQTFDLFEQFQGSEMLRIRNRLAEKSNSGDVKSLQGEQDFFAFVDFFDAVETCIERHLCDSDLAGQLFKPYAKGAWLKADQLIGETRDSECTADFDLNRPYGYGLEAIATGKPPVSPCRQQPQLDTR